METSWSGCCDKKLKQRHFLPRSNVLLLSKMKHCKILNMQRKLFIERSVSYCTVPNLQGCILPTYTKKVVGRVQEQPFLSRTKQLILLASHCQGSETTPALFDGSSSSFLDVLVAVKSLQATWESFGLKLCLRWNSLDNSLLLLISILYFILALFPFSFYCFSLCIFILWVF